MSHPYIPPAKKSLGIFSVLEDVLDKRDARAQQQQAQQDKLAARLQAQEDRAAAMRSRTIEDALHEAQAKALETKPQRTVVGDVTDPVTGQVYNRYSDGTAEPIKMGGFAPQDPTVPPSTLKVGVKPKEKHTQLVQNAAGDYVVADMDTGLGPDGKPIKAYHEPKTPQDKTPAPSDFEKKANFMLEGTRSAVQALDDYAPRPQSLASHVPIVGNYMLSDADQLAQSNAETLHDAYLRLTTGASIQPSELTRAAKQYIAQPGDSPATLALKKERRHQVLRAIERSASAVRGPESAVQAGVGPSKPPAAPSNGSVDVMARYGLTPPPKRKTP